MCTMDFIGRSSFDDSDREDISCFEALELRFRLFVLPPRTFNVGNRLLSSAAITEVPLVDWLQPLETLSVAVNDAKSRRCPCIGGCQLLPARESL